MPEYTIVLKKQDDDLEVLAHATPEHDEYMARVARVNELYGVYFDGRRHGLMHKQAKAAMHAEARGDVFEAAVEEIAAVAEAQRIVRQVPTVKPATYCEGCGRVTSGGPQCLKCYHVKRSAALAALSTRPVTLTCLMCGKGLSVRRGPEQPTHCRQCRPKARRLEEAA